MSLSDFVELALGLVGLGLGGWLGGWLLDKMLRALTKNKVTNEIELNAHTHDAVLRDYFALMEQRPFLPTRIEDVSALPHSKTSILEAILKELRQTKSKEARERLAFAAAGLAQYQSNVGAEPLEMLGIDIATFPRTNDLNVLKKEVALLASLDSKRNRFNTFNKVVEVELSQILQKIEAIGNA
jgi:hypothetical protein